MKKVRLQIVENQWPLLQLMKGFIFANFVGKFKQCKHCKSIEQRSCLKKLIAWNLATTTIY